MRFAMAIEELVGRSRATGSGDAKVIIGTCARLPQGVRVKTVSSLSTPRCGAPMESNDLALVLEHIEKLGRRMDEQFGEMREEMVSLKEAIRYLGKKQLSPLEETEELADILNLNDPPAESRINI